jgi:rhodanese-related sulfurtransferase
LLTSTNLQAEVGNLSNEHLKKMQEQNVPIIDIRRPDEWRSTGVISGSYLLTFFDAKGNYNLNQWLAELNDIAGKDKPFILVCRSGNRTGQVAHFLNKKLGYTRVYHLKDGIKNWIKTGDKVVTAQKY